MTALHIICSLVLAGVVSFWFYSLIEIYGSVIGYVFTVISSLNLFLCVIFAVLALIRIVQIHRSADPEIVGYETATEV